MCVLVDKQIKQLGADGCIVPYNVEQVNPASYDLTIDNYYIDQYTGETVRCGGYNPKTIELYPPSILRDMVYEVKKFIFGTVLRGKFGLPYHKPSAILATTIETVQIPDWTTGDIKLKSSLARAGLDHALAGFCDPGFCGQVTLELHAHRHVSLKYGQRIAQLIYTLTDQIPDKSYNGNYQGQYGPTKSVLDVKR